MSSNKYCVYIHDAKLFKSLSQTNKIFYDVPLDETPTAPPNTPVIDISENSYLLNLKKKKLLYTLQPLSSLPFCSLLPPPHPSFSFPRRGRERMV